MMCGANLESSILKKLSAWMPQVLDASVSTFLRSWVFYVKQTKYACGRTDRNPLVQSWMRQVMKPYLVKDILLINTKQQVRLTCCF